MTSLQKSHDLLEKSKRRLQLLQKNIITRPVSVNSSLSASSPQTTPKHAVDSVHNFKDNIQNQFDSIASKENSDNIQNQFESLAAKENSDNIQKQFDSLANLSKRMQMIHSDFIDSQTKVSSQQSKIGILFINLQFRTKLWIRFTLYSKFKKLNFPGS